MFNSFIVQFFNNKKLKDITHCIVYINVLTPQANLLFLSSLSSSSLLFHPPPFSLFLSFLSFYLSSFVSFSLFCLTMSIEYITTDMIDACKDRLRKAMPPSELPLCQHGDSCLELDVDHIVDRHHTMEFDASRSLYCRSCKCHTYHKWDKIIPFCPPDGEDNRRFASWVCNGCNSEFSIFVGSKLTPIRYFCEQSYPYSDIFPKETLLPSWFIDSMKSPLIS